MNGRDNTIVPTPHHPTTLRRLPCAAALLILSSAASMAHAQWSVTILHPEGSTHSVGRGVSDNLQVGETVVGGIVHANLWSGSAASWTDLRPAGATDSYANGVGGGQQVGDAIFGGVIRAGLWSGWAASWVDLHPAGATESIAIATSGTQQAGYATMGGIDHACLWSGSATSWVDLNPAGSAGSFAYGISGGQQVGFAYPGTTAHAALWSGSAASWVDLNPAAAGISFAYGVSGGQQVGIATQSADDPGHASLWNGSAASWVDLNPAGATYSEARGVGGGRQVGRALINGESHAALWSGSAASFEDLHAFVPEGYSSSQAYAVWSDANVTYVLGTGFYSQLQQYEALLWTRGIAAAPTNNDCAHAINVGSGNTPFSNVAATTDGPSENVCNFFGDNQVGSDIWFRYAATCSGTVTLSLCGSSYDTKVAVYGATCPSGPGTALACNDDSCSVQSIVSFSSMVGQMYLIRLGGYSGFQGTGTMNIACVPTWPPNDACAAAIDVSSGGDFIGSLIAATNDGSAGCGSSATAKDVWYTYAAQCTGTLHISTCGTHDMGGVDTGMDSVLSVHSACPGTTSNQLACNDDTNTCGSLDTGSLRDSAVTVPVNAGSIYKLRVSVYADSAANNFLLHVNLLLPANDDCASASAVTSGGTPVSNCGATQDGVSTGCRAGFNDVWYGYTATCNGNVTVDTCNANFDSVLFAYSGTACPATQARQVACNDDFCGGSGLSSHIVFAATSGQAFLIRFASFDPAQSGSATMTVSCSVSCPCDWNRDAHLNSQDFFDFLTSFFAANADFNHDGITNSQDFFDFLSCLFAGCP